jgi:hypothetical protein
MRTLPYVFELWTSVNVHVLATKSSVRLKRDDSILSIKRMGKLGRRQIIMMIDRRKMFTFGLLLVTLVLNCKQIETN